MYHEWNNEIIIVLVNPNSPPKIRGTKQQYVTGETVNATCLSAPSRPAAILKWWINEKAVSKDISLTYTV